MDIEKLIEDLQWWAEHCDRTNYGCETRTILSDAATAISTLQIENQALRNSANGFKAENEKLRAELEEVKSERAVALEHLHGICSACKNYSPYHNRGKCRSCAYEPARDKDAEANDNWEWRGPQKED